MSLLEETATVECGCCGQSLVDEVALVLMIEALSELEIRREQKRERDRAAWGDALRTADAAVAAR